MQVSKVLARDEDNFVRRMAAANTQKRTWDAVGLVPFEFEIRLDCLGFTKIT
jgi:hypothetical protein